MRFDFALAVNIAQFAGPVLGGGAGQQSVAPQQPSTSEFRTANYITHGLPQQCLPSPYKPRAAAAEASGLPNSADIVVPENGTSSTTEGMVVTVTEVREPVSANGEGEGQNIQQQEQQQSPHTMTMTVTQHVDKKSLGYIEGEDLDDEASALDSTQFLSFDEWREQNLAKAGQSSEDFEQRAPIESRRRNGAGINNDLDTIGDDGEIELDFGSEGGGNELHEGPQRKPEAKPQDKNKPVRQGRSKMAGKTGKERFNYASFDCAATVHKTNREVKGASAILSEHKDSYMLNECRAENKFVIVELCDDILVDTVVLANYEFFSSMFRTFRVSVSAKYPVKASAWKELGVFEARNSREIQAFLVENPWIWARYLKIDFLTHYGSEFYCPVSLLRIHGTTMMEEFRVQTEAAIGIEDDVEDEVVEEEGEGNGTSPSAGEVQESPGIIKELVEKIMDTGLVILGEDKDKHKEKEKEEEKIAEEDNVTHTFPSPSVEIYKPAIVGSVPLIQPTGLPKCTPNELRKILLPDPKTCAAKYTPSPTVPIMSKSSTSMNDMSVSGNSTRPTPTGTGVGAGKSDSAIDRIKTQTSTSNPPSSIPSSSKNPEPPQQHHQQQQQQAQDGSNHGSHSQRYYTSPTAPPPAVPTTQESFYKHMAKRLVFLETNATLTLQYIEEQSKSLREALAKVERRFNHKQSAFVELVNSTLRAELGSYRQQYDQLWQSTVIELENQRRQSETEILAVSSRLALLADEVIYQKRMSYVQSLLLLVCIALVIFTKSSHYDGPILHSMRSGRGAVETGGGGVGFESPPNSPEQQGVPKSPVSAGDGVGDDDDSGEARVGVRGGEAGSVIGGGGGGGRVGRMFGGRKLFFSSAFLSRGRSRGGRERRDSMDSVGSEAAGGLMSPTSPTSGGGFLQSAVGVGGGYDTPMGGREGDDDERRMQSPERPQSPMIRSSPATPTGTRGRRVGAGGGGGDGDQGSINGGGDGAGIGAGVNEDSWKVFGPNIRVAELKAAHAGKQAGLGTGWRHAPSPLREGGIGGGRGGRESSVSSSSSSATSPRQEAVKRDGRVVFREVDIRDGRGSAVDVCEDDGDVNGVEMLEHGGPEQEGKGWEYNRARRKSEPAIIGVVEEVSEKGQGRATREGGLSSPPPSPPLVAARGGGGEGGAGGSGSGGANAGGGASGGGGGQQGQGHGKGHSRNGSRGSGGGGGGGGGKKKKGRR